MLTEMRRAGVLDDKRADFHRRKESLEKLEEQLAAYQALLEEEDREAKERLESARLAKVRDAASSLRRWRRCESVPRRPSSRNERAPRRTRAPPNSRPRRRLW